MPWASCVRRWISCAITPKTRQGLIAPARGTFVCISPWNFPLAIFTGQIAAALAAGNAVIAKPAEQTPLIATLAVDLMLQAGRARDGAATAAGGWRHGRRGADRLTRGWQAWPSPARPRPRRSIRPVDGRTP